MNRDQVDVARFIGWVECASPPLPLPTPQGYVWS
jgi:hypothetical protein